MRYAKSWLVAFAFLAIASPSAAQRAADPSTITLDRLTSGEFYPRFVGRSRWLEDGSSYTTLERSATGAGRDLVRYDAVTGERDLPVRWTSKTTSGLRTGGDC
jgi:dipeptidyl-peptidase-4